MGFWYIMNQGLTMAYTAKPTTHGLMPSDTAIGAMNACKSAGIDDMIIVGFDGNQSAVDLILAGEMVKATVAQQPYEMGYQAVEAALKAIKGETVEEVINAPVTVVTAENGQEYLDSLAAMQG